MHIKPITKLLAALTAAGALIIISAYHSKTGRVIQVDVSAILNARPVTTLSQGNLQSWTTGVDKENGYLTTAAALFAGGQDTHALPDDPLIPPNKSHPEILLHYANEVGPQNQARCIPDTGEFAFKVPKAKYAGLYVSITSSYGTSSLQFELTYTDGVEIKDFVVPDWYSDIPDNDPDFSYVAHNMGKWGSKNNLQEKDHHNIDALNIHPNPNRVLKAVKLKKLPGGYLLFWAATGVMN